MNYHELFRTLWKNQSEKKEVNSENEVIGILSYRQSPTPDWDFHDFFLSNLFFLIFLPSYVNSSLYLISDFIKTYPENLSAWSIDLFWNVFEICLLGYNVIDSRTQQC